MDREIAQLSKISRKYKLYEFIKHFWSWLFLAASIVIVLTAVTFSFIQAATPLISKQRHHIENWLSEFLHYPVTIDKITAQWNGFEPTLKFVDTTLYSPSEKPLLAIKALSVGLNLWQSLIHWDLQIDRIGIFGTKITIQNQRDGKILIRSNSFNPLIVIDPKQNTSSSILNEFANIKKVDINNIEIDWQQQNRALLPFQNVSVKLQRQNITHGWIISGNKLQITYLGKKTPQTRFYLRNQQGQYQFYLDKLPLELLLNLFQNSNQVADPKSISLPIAKFIQQVKLGGILNAFYLQYKNNNDFAAMGELKNVNLVSKMINLAQRNTKFYIFPTQGMLELNGQSKLDAPKFLGHSINAKDLSGKIFWKQINLGWSLFTPNLKLTTQNGIVSLVANVMIPNIDKQNPFLNLTLNIENFNLAKLKNNLPTIDNKNLQKWLSKAFIKGSIAAAKINIQGNIKDFPFDNKPGIFTAEADINNLTLNYKKGWPWMSQIYGKLFFNKHDIKFQVAQGYLFNNKIIDTVADITNINDAAKTNLTVDSIVTGNLENTKQFLIKSPLYNNVGRHLVGLDLKGAMRMHLNLDIPLASNYTDTNKVSGTLFTSAANLGIPGWNINLTSIDGALEFSDQNFHAQKIKAQLLQQPVTINVTTVTKNDSSGIGKKENTTQVDIFGKLNVDQLKKQYSNSLLTNLSGALNYNAQLQLSNEENTTLKLTSNLSGLKSDFPAPFTKSTSQNWPSSINLNFQDNKNKVVVMNINDVSAKLNFKSAANKQTDLFVDGKFPMVSFMAWKQLFEKQADETNYNIFLRQANLNIKKLDIYGHIFDALVAITRFERGWQVTMNGSNISGIINFPDQSNKVILGNFNKLYLNKAIAKTSTETTNFSNINPQKIPSLNVYINDFHYQKVNLGTVNLITAPMNLGLKINTLTVESPNLKLSAVGQWQKTQQKMQTQLQGNLAAKNIADIMQLFSYPTTIQAKNFQTEFQLSWPDAPYNMVMKTLTGTLKLNTGSGQIINLGKNAENTIATGEILSLFSLKSLQRRVKLNFSDLTSKGFNFDSIKGDFLLEKGNAITKNMTIKGIIAQINIIGRIGIKWEDFNLNLEVIPYVTSSLPIIATIAGGPVIGAATWLADVIIAPQIDKMSTRYFKLSGTWHDPIVERKSKKEMS